jgi:hypothetical protein
MNSEEIRSEISAILEMDLSNLVDGAEDVEFPPQSFSLWNFPPEHRREMTQFGLPPKRQDGLVAVRADFQQESRPKLLFRESRFYQIGTFGGTVIGVEEGTGKVMEVPTSTDFHPQLAYLFPDGVQAQLVNSNVGSFVDFSWRWHLLASRLEYVGNKTSEAEAAAYAARDRGELTAPPDIFAFEREICQQIIDGLALRDEPAILGKVSIWRNVITAGL